MSLSTHEVGRRCEAIAARFLTEAGWTVLERNVRFRRKEIDLVLRRGRVVAFVEVKGRKGGGWGHPLDAITALKRREIETVARWWVDRFGRPGDHYRFDAVAVHVRGLDVVKVEHVEDAWRSGE
ncbi:MAG: YraN family protein [Gemmatimonadetes bacterium]|nr:YraN family protein [Gemmatimonadota bacterium]